MPDVFPDYRGSCGRCYEIKCRGIQAISADGSVNLDRSDACLDTTTSIIIKIVDTCPCNGNEKWCCGDMPHFDLSDRAFQRVSRREGGCVGVGGVSGKEHGCCCSRRRHARRECRGQPGQACPSVARSAADLRPRTHPPPWRSWRPRARELSA